MLRRCGLCLQVRGEVRIARGPGPSQVNHPFAQYGTQIEGIRWARYAPACPSRFRGPDVSESWRLPVSRPHIPRVFPHSSHAMRRIGFLAASSVAAIAFLPITTPLSTKNLPGFSAESARVELDWESKFAAIPSPDTIRQNMRRWSARPHHVGSPYDHDNAECRRGWTGLSRVAGERCRDGSGNRDRQPTDADRQRHVPPVWADGDRCLLDRWHVGQRNRRSFEQRSAAR